MNTLIIVLSIFLPLLILALPFLKKWLDQMGLKVTEKQYDLLKKSVGDAVNHVNQVAEKRGLDSEKKKELATKVAKNIATKLGITKDKQDLAADLIETVIWEKEELDSEAELEDEAY